MRIAMPLFDFMNSSGQEFEFGDGVYSLRKFDPAADIPEGDLPGLSRMDLDFIKREHWALVATDPDLTVYRQDINLLLLSFKIHTLARLFIKYRLCVADTSLCSVVLEKMNFISRERSRLQVSYEQLEQVNLGFQRLREMDAIDSVSNRPHNAIYFMYGAYFTAPHAIYLFVLLFTVLEALFSKEEGGAATRTICERVSSFLGSKPRCSYSNIERLYNIRSELVHGRRKASQSAENLADAHELEFVVTQCMRKMLGERIWPAPRKLRRNEVESVA